MTSRKKEKKETCNEWGSTGEPQAGSWCACSPSLWVVLCGALGSHLSLVKSREKGGRQVQCQQRPEPGLPGCRRSCGLLRMQEPAQPGAPLSCPRWSPPASPRLPHPLLYHGQAHTRSLFISRPQTRLADQVGAEELALAGWSAVLGGAAVPS